MLYGHLAVFWLDLRPDPQEDACVCSWKSRQKLLVWELTDTSSEPNITILIIIILLLEPNITKLVQY